MHCMIMVPQQSRRLLVGIVVIFVLPWVGDIFRPTIERGTRVRSVKMNRVLGSGVVDESDDRLRSARNNQCRSRRDAVVAHQSCRAQVGINRLTERLDLKLVVPDLLVRDWVDDLSVRYVRKTASKQKGSR